MFEYHGWVTVLESAGDDEIRLRRIVDGLRAHVGSVAPGSYGLIHIRDDEDPGHENEVRDLRLVRGTVTEHTETLLSPCVPTREDPFGLDGF
ncbi:Imm7 family immunity protein [Streptomyces sp. NPDC004542]|uniref:Imm7 family immunity protein n=1 Tax=Streptomyces sp. NPDC004542 TaxID=3154281 RepID=UPI0033B044ED